MYQKTIKLFLYDCNPNERIICELSNWNGIAYKIPKTMLKDSRKGNLPYIENTGIYFLFGKKDDLPYVYIGETENLYSRLVQHLNDERDLWEECITFTRVDNSFNKAHVKYMEHLLYKDALKSARYEVDNASTPDKVTLCMNEEAEMKEVMDNIKMLTNALGYKLFVDSENPKMQKNKILYFNSRSFEAMGIETSEGFMVLEGSKMNRALAPSLCSSQTALRNRLIQQNIVNEDYVFTENYLFNSSSSAAGVVSGYSSSGPQSWKDKNGKTLKILTEEVVNNVQ